MYGEIIICNDNILGFIESGTRFITDVPASSRYLDHSVSCNKKNFSAFVNRGGGRKSGPKKVKCAHFRKMLFHAVSRKKKWSHHPNYSEWNESK